MAGACDNCAGEDVALVRVHRLYVEPDGLGGVRSVTRVPEPERWCSSCLSQYPCERADSCDG